MESRLSDRRSRVSHGKGEWSYGYAVEFPNLPSPVQDQWGRKYAFPRFCTQIPNSQISCPCIPFKEN